MREKNAGRSGKGWTCGMRNGRASASSFCVNTGPCVCPASGLGERHPSHRRSVYNRLPPPAPPRSVRGLVGHSLAHSLAHSSTYSFVHSYIHSITLSLTHSWFTHTFSSYVHPLHPSPTRLLSHTFIHSLTRPLFYTHSNHSLHSSSRSLIHSIPILPLALIQLLPFSHSRSLIPSIPNPSSRLFIPTISSLTLSLTYSIILSLTHSSTPSLTLFLTHLSTPSLIISLFHPIPLSLIDPPLSHPLAHSFGQLVRLLLKRPSFHPLIRTSMALPPISSLPSCVYLSV